MIWLDGRLLDAASARIDPADRGLLLGDGVFETVGVAARRPLHLAPHLARLRQGAAVLDIANPWNDAAIEGGIADLLAEWGRADAVLRVTLTRGPAGRGLLPPAGTRATLLMTLAERPPPLPPAHAITALATRRNEHSPLSRIKSLNYLDSILARQEAASRGADEALLLNTQGLLAEATASTVFLVRSGRAATPRVEDGALPGIARALVLHAGRAVEQALGPDDLLACEAGFLTNSLGLRAIDRMDGRPLALPDATMLATIRSLINSG